MVSPNRTYRGRPRSIDRDVVLDAWASPGQPLARRLADRFGVTKECIKSIVHRARRAGDPRAVERGKDHREGGTFIRLFLDCRADGTPVEKMARISGWSPKEVRKVLAAHDRRSAGKCRLHVSPASCAHGVVGQGSASIRPSSA